MSGRRHAEQGMSISMAVLALTIISMIMLYIGTQTLNSMYTARTKQDRSVGMAAGDSAIEKYRAALVQHLADESNGFLLDRAALVLLVDQQSGASVVPNRQTSEAARMAPVRVPAASRFTVREVGTDSIGYWQLYDVVQPRYLPSAASDLVVYIRAWATARNGSGAITTKPRVFRIEYRPGYFSDYQSVTDGPFIVRDNTAYTINGPIHSNGYTTVDWLAKDNAGATRRGIWFEKSARCSAAARFSTSQKAPIVVPGCPTQVAAGRTSARQISLLGVSDTFRFIQRRCGTIVVCLTGQPFYDVRLANDQVIVNGRAYGFYRGADSHGLTVLLDADVVLHGSLRMPAGVAGRLTIATRRRSIADRQPQVYLRGTSGSVVGAWDTATTSVGVITEGDVVLDGPAPSGPSYPCMSQINLAAISQSGSVTIPPEFVTLAPPAVNLNGRACTRPTLLHGSFASHGQFLASLVWPDVRTGGRTPAVGYTTPELRYDRNLFLDPPPFFPLATPWGVTKVKDADDRCLVGSQAGSPTCE